MKTLPLGRRTGPAPGQPKHSTGGKDAQLHFNDCLRGLFSRGLSATGTSSSLSRTCTAFYQTRLSKIPHSNTPCNPALVRQLISDMMLIDVRHLRLIQVLQGIYINTITLAKSDEVAIFAFFMSLISLLMCAYFVCKSPHAPVLAPVPLVNLSGRRVPNMGRTSDRTAG